MTQHWAVTVWRGESAEKACYMQLRHLELQSKNKLDNSRSHGKGNWVRYTDLFGFRLHLFLSVVISSTHYSFFLFLFCLTFFLSSLFFLSFSFPLLSYLHYLFLWNLLISYFILCSSISFLIPLFFLHHLFHSFSFPFPLIFAPYSFYSLFLSFSFYFCEYFPLPSFFLYICLRLSRFFPPFFSRFSFLLYPPSSYPYTRIYFFHLSFFINAFILFFPFFFLILSDFIPLFLLFSFFTLAILSVSVSFPHHAAEKSPHEQLPTNKQNCIRTDSKPRPLSRALIYSCLQQSRYPGHPL